MARQGSRDGNAGRQPPDGRRGGAGSVLHASGGAGRAGGFGGPGAEVTTIASPDGRLEAFIQNCNVAVRPPLSGPAGGLARPGSTATASAVTSS